MRATVLLVAALLVVGAAVPMAAGVSASDDRAATDTVLAQEETANETDNETETAPGAILAGVVDVQGAEVEGEVERRSFGLQVKAANSNASKASVVANQTRALDERLADLRERKQELEAARENETISESRYRAEVAGLAARISTLRVLSNETAETARSLPAEALEANGVNVSALEQLRTSASNLSGPEVAAIARDITGPSGNDSNGPPFGSGLMGPPSDTPAGGDEENETDTGSAPADPGAPDNPGDATGDTNDEQNATATDDEAAGNGNGGEAGPPDDAGSGNNGNSDAGRPLLDWSVLADLLP